MTSIKVCHALDTAVNDARVEIVAESRIRRTTSGGRTVRGSLPGDVEVILKRGFGFEQEFRERKDAGGVNYSAVPILLTALIISRR